MWMVENPFTCCIIFVGPVGLRKLQKKGEQKKSLENMARSSNQPMHDTSHGATVSFWGFIGFIVADGDSDHPQGLHLTVPSWSLCGERWVKLQVVFLT